MDVSRAIGKRRAYRSLEPVRITNEMVHELASAASLAASCNNKQPWRFVFVKGDKILTKMQEAMTRGNAWTKHASMIVAVCSKRDFDCVYKGREYYHFDTGMATAHLILRATELGLVAHPIAGFYAEKVREILGIPEDIEVITLINVGKYSTHPNDVVDTEQIEKEKTRPERIDFEDFASIDGWEG